MTMYGPLGSLDKTADGNVITFNRTLPAPPEKVWEALTTSDGVMAWLAPIASIDARSGGAVEIEFDDENTVTGEITQFDPYSRFAHTWIINGEVPSAVSWELVPEGAGTALTLIHTQLPDEMVGGYTPGWHAFMARLDAMLAGQPLPDFMDVVGSVASSYS